MRSHEGHCKVPALEPRTFVDVTQEVEAAIESSGILEGMVTLAIDNGGCALVVNERESGLLWDIERALDRVDGRARVGAGSVALPLEKGRLRLGTWQRVLLLELEGSSDRVITVTTEGE